MTKPVWSHVLAFEESSCNQFPRNLSLDYKYLHAGQIPHNKTFPPKPYMTI